MTLPVVHHPAFVAPMPAGHRFPMGKFGRVMSLLLEDGVVTPAQVHVPEPAPRAWLELAHDPGCVDGVLNQNLDPAAIRRIGLPVTAEVALRSRAANGGTVLTARLALEHGVACNTAGGSQHAFFGYGSGFCVFNDVAVATRVLLAEGAIERALVVDLDVHQGDGTAAMLADEPRVFTFSMHCQHNFPLRKQTSDFDLPLDAGLEDATYLRLLAAALDPTPGRLSGARRISLPMHIYEATSGKPVAVILLPGKMPGGAEAGRAAAERELDAATTSTELNAAAKRLMRAKAALKALTSEQPT